jgi:D-alanine-D-alanine ligase
LGYTGVYSETDRSEHSTETRTDVKIAIVYNRDSKRVINLFGMPNQEKIGLKTIQRVANGLKSGGHQVKTIEGDKDLLNNLEQFMPRVVKGELPGMVFNVSYGIQGQARYTHVPSILEMAGVPYVGSGPLAHSLALDKVVAKMIFQQNGIPTPRFAVLDDRGFDLPDLEFPLIVKPKNEAVSFGLRIVRNEDELREGAEVIFKEFRQPVLAEQYIDGREVNVGLLGNNPPETLPPVELIFGTEGPPIYTVEDKKRKSGREVGWQCPAELDSTTLDEARSIALKAFSALGCHDCARVDMRLDNAGNLYVLEINSLPSLGEHGSYTIAAAAVGLDFDRLVCRLVEVASSRYFGTPTPPSLVRTSGSPGDRVFTYLVERRDDIEKKVGEWVKLPSRTNDPTGIAEANKRISGFCHDMRLKPVPQYTDERSVTTWETRKGMEGGILLIAGVDVPNGIGTPSQMFRRDPEWLYGEGVGASRAPIICLQYALKALRSVRQLKNIPLGVLFYSDEGRESRYSHSFITAAAASAGSVLVLRPGNQNDNVVDQRRGWRKYVLKVTGKPRRLGKIHRKKDVLRWTMSAIDEMTRLTSKDDRLAVACSDMRTESYPQLLPHRISATILINYLDEKQAESAEAAIRKILESRDYGHSLELISDRPPFIRTKKRSGLYRSLRKTADQWEIPLHRESSLFPSVAGLVPSTSDVICGVGPVARDTDTPQESVLRISLVQRTLLLAQFLLKHAVSNNK